MLPSCFSLSLFPLSPSYFGFQPKRPLLSFLPSFSLLHFFLPLSLSCFLDWVFFVCLEPREDETEGAGLPEGEGRSFFIAILAIFVSSKLLFVDLDLFTVFLGHEWMVAPSGNPGREKGESERDADRWINRKSRQKKGKNLEVKHCLSNNDQEGYKNFFF